MVSLVHNIRIPEMGKWYQADQELAKTHEGSFAKSVNHQHAASLELLAQWGGH